jgi:hypothetical protein
VQKPVENLVNLHAAEMVQTAGMNPVIAGKSPPFDKLRAGFLAKNARNGVPFFVATPS